MDTTSETAPKAAADHDLQQSVLDELQWTPDVDAARIGVAVADGVVTLSGELDSAAERFAAKRAVQRIAGVRAIADELHVRTSKWSGLTDADIAANAAAALERTPVLPDGAVQVSVRSGAVTLTGAVPWNYQRLAARHAVEHLAGVESVHDWIGLSARPSAEATADRIRAALLRDASVDAATIRVSVNGTTVVLEGTVRSFAEKAEAVRTAWASPHVTAVEDRIRVHG